VKKSFAQLFVVSQPETLLFFFGFIQLFTRRQIRELLQMPGSQRLRNRVFFAKPFAEIYHLATFRAEWAVPSAKPVPVLLAYRALDSFRRCHTQQLNTNPLRRLGATFALRPRSKPFLRHSESSRKTGYGYRATQLAQPRLSKPFYIVRNCDGLLALTTVRLEGRLNIRKNPGRVGLRVLGWIENRV